MLRESHNTEFIEINDEKRKYYEKMDKMHEDLSINF